VSEQPRAIPGRFKVRCWARTVLTMLDGVLSVCTFSSNSVPFYDGPNLPRAEEPGRYPARWLSAFAKNRSVLGRVVASAESEIWDAGAHPWELDIELEDAGVTHRWHLRTRDVPNARRYSAGANVALVDSGKGEWLLYPPLLDHLYLGNEKE
jgi:hypothetical protein